MKLSSQLIAASLLSIFLFSTPDKLADQKYLKMTFTAKKLNKLDNRKFGLAGDLTIKDKTHPVTFEIEYKDNVTAYGVKGVAFGGEAKISKKKFGLTWNNVVEHVPNVGDKVRIELMVQAKRKADVS